jgi:hypothetical protein
MMADAFDAALPTLSALAASAVEVQLTNATMSKSGPGKRTRDGRCIGSSSFFLDNSGLA